MEELFGISMNIIMVVLLAIVLPAMAVVAVMAWRNRIMLKMGLRNIPRRRCPDRPHHRRNNAELRNNGRCLRHWRYH